MNFEKKTWKWRELTENLAKLYQENRFFWFQREIYILSLLSNGFEALTHIYQTMRGIRAARNSSVPVRLEARQGIWRNFMHQRGPD